jgi:cytochrome c oxidase assembly protein subunit 15
MARRRAFGRFAWAVLVYTVFVVLLGAVVRITGSGAGCGQHWPTCQGEVVHLPRSVETAIELAHRVTSGFSIVAAIALPVWAFRVFPRGHGVRGAALASLGLMCVEALIGAVLVLFRLVADDVSAARAIVLPIHLANTSLLLGAMAITAWASVRETWALHWPRLGIEWLLPFAMAGVLVVSGMGAVTALGDTLFPVAVGGDLTDRIAADHAAYAHFLQRMRILHPLGAVAVGVLLLPIAQVVAGSRPAAARWCRAIQVLVVVQLVAGAVNVVLAAPGWMQVVHLALAVALWLSLVLGWAVASAGDERESAVGRSGARSLDGPKSGARGTSPRDDGRSDS